MNLHLAFRGLAAACCLVALAGCGVNRQIDRDLTRQQHDLVSRSITLNARDSGVPAARITPDDALFIDHRPVPLDANQQALVHRYREQTLRIALQGIEIGRRGATIGTHEIWPATFMALFGASDATIERHVKRQLGPVREAALALCDQLPALMSTGTQLADALPAFRPYATLTPEKIAQCREDVDRDMRDDVARAGAH